MKRKILVGFSGGVDSTASIFSFLEAGYDVTPLFLVLSPYQEERIEGIRDFCSANSLKCVIADERETFRREIIDYFASEYMHGRTPNPCAMCNRFIKFPLMNRYMKELGCSSFSTGHYIRVIDGNLFKSPDDERDQTYFVSTARKEHLLNFINPLTSFSRKDDVRAFLRERNITPLENSESREICFVKGNYTDFLVNEGYAEDNEGEILDIQGHVLGKHEGSFRYTVGERIGVGGLSGRLYVSSTDPDRNIVYASSKEELSKDFMDVEAIEVFSDPIPDNLKVRTRYRQKEMPCILERGGERGFRVRFSEKSEAVTPGQIAVFYEGDRVAMSAVRR